jgi:hypothetical protein
MEVKRHHPEEVGAVRRTESALERYYATMDGKLDGDLFDLLADDFEFEIDGETSGSKSDYMALRADYKQLWEAYPQGHTILASATMGGLEVIIGDGFVTAAQTDGDGRLRRSIILHHSPGPSTTP